MKIATLIILLLLTTLCSNAQTPSSKYLYGDAAAKSVLLQNIPSIYSFAYGLTKSDGITIQIDPVWLKKHDDSVIASVTAPRESFQDEMDRTAQGAGTNIKANGVVEDSMYYNDSFGLYYKWNNKYVPMGVYSDTSIVNYGTKYSDIRHIEYVVFIDRRMIFRTYFIVDRDSEWIAWYDKSLLNKMYLR